MSNDILTTTRSAIEIRQRCKNERFLSNHYDGIGLEKKSGKYEAKFGNCLHDIMKMIMQAAKEFGLDGALKVRIDTAPLEEIIETQFVDLPIEELNHLVEEQKALLYTLVDEWRKRRLPGILKEYEIVAVETEQAVVFHPADYLPPQLAQLLRPVRIPFRFDVLLRRKGDGLLFILDFKTASGVSEDWNITLDNSAQSHLYCEAAKIIYQEPIGGIFYAGMIKGYRQMDKAKSSPYRGYTIQYGSFLYGWKDRNGVVHKDYVTGRFRQELWSDGNLALHNLDDYFPITIPWKPINTGEIVGQQIVAENNFANDLELYNEFGVNSPEKALYEKVIFEKSLGMCFKYGTKHPCQFVNICHGNMHEDEIRNMYDKRVPHHKEV